MLNTSTLAHRCRRRGVHLIINRRGDEAYEVRFVPNSGLVADLIRGPSWARGGGGGGREKEEERRGRRRGEERGGGKEGEERDRVSFFCRAGLTGRGITGPNAEGTKGREPRPANGTSRGQHERRLAADHLTGCRPAERPTRDIQPRK